MSYLQCKNIKKAFGAVVALQDATLTVEKGEIHAILGGNGSGKSTLAKIIGGSVFSDSGEIWIDGHLTQINSPIQARQMGIVMTSQELSLFNNQTVEENLDILEEKSIVKSNKKESAKRIGELLERLGIADVQKMKVTELPEDKKYLVEFSKAVQYNPKILIIDEITSALFRDEVALVKKMLNELAEKGCAIIFISHRLQEIYSISSTVTVMRNGEVINTHSLDDSEEQLLREMIGSDSLYFETDGAQNEEPLNGSCDVLKNLLCVQNFTIPGFKGKMGFEVGEGEMIGIAGLQGQGQSQLLRSLFGINHPMHLTVNGAWEKIDSPRAAIKKGIAYLSGDRQKEGVYYGRSIYENIKVVTAQVLPDKDFDEDELMKKFSVKYKSKNQEIQTLSGGNQQKVVTARWVGVKPKLILADDPTKGIDVMARKDVHKIFADLVRDGASVIMSSSDDDELVKIAEVVKNYKVFVMYGGEIVKVLEGKDINISNIISNSMPRGEKHE